MSFNRNWWKQPPEEFCEKGVLRNFAKFRGKQLWQSLFFNKVAGLRPATLLKKRLWQRCFPVNFVKFLRTPFLQNTSGRLFLGRELLLSFKGSQVITFTIFFRFLTILYSWPDYINMIFFFLVHFRCYELKLK